MQLPPYLRIGEVGEAVKQYLDGKSFNKLAILCDRRTAKDCLPRLRDAIHLDPALVIEIPEGEEAKTLDSCQQVWHQLTAGGFSRHDLLINLGGGMVTDLGGFCASTYKRGIDFIQIPTSLLAMVDASIGAKTGINFKGIKNHIGLFRDPGSVIIDIGFLDTLDDRQWWNGYAEMVKHAALQGSEALNQYLSTIKRSDSEEMIRNSLAFKWSIVLNDPNETGKRKILNLGHSLGHAIESTSNGKVLHGEAVMAGLEMEFSLAESKLGLDPLWRNKVSAFRKEHYPVLPDFNSVDLMKYLQQDKKNRDGNILVCLLSEPGSAKYDVAVTETDLFKLFEEYGIK